MEVESNGKGSRPAKKANTQVRVKTHEKIVSGREGFG